MGVEHGQAVEVAHGSLCVFEKRAVVVDAGVDEGVGDVGYGDAALLKLPAEQGVFVTVFGEPGVERMLLHLLAADHEVESGEAGVGLGLPCGEGAAAVGVALVSVAQFAAPGSVVGGEQSAYDHGGLMARVEVAPKEEFVGRQSVAVDDNEPIAGGYADGGVAIAGAPLVLVLGEIATAFAGGNGSKVFLDGGLVGGAVVG